MNGAPEGKAAADDLDFDSVYARLLASARGDAIVEDRLQEACVRLLEKTRQTDIRNQGGYFQRILRNLKIDELRRLTRYAALPLSDVLPDPAPGPDRAAQARQELARVAKALEDLPPRCRAAFELHRFGNLSYAQIAHHMGISISMVEKHVAEALLRLVAALDDSL